MLNVLSIFSYYSLILTIQWKEVNNHFIVVCMLWLSLLLLLEASVKKLKINLEFNISKKFTIKCAYKSYFCAQFAS